MRESEIIYCPKCKNRFDKYDGRPAVNIITKCNICKKRVIYHVDTGEIEIKELPPRKSSSGVEFC